jgi:DNA-binding response OmpR family regulator
VPLSTESAVIKILIVDDQVSNVRLLEHTLRRAGYADVAATTDPKQVAGLQRQNHYDLILLDLQMPAMSGFQVMQQLRDEAGGERQLTILVISADPALLVAALEAGANDFLSKPFRLTDVVDRVQLLMTKTGPQKVAEPDPARSEERHTSPQVRESKNGRS